MNATNRVLNRAVLLLVGLALAAVGAAALLVAVQPAWAQPALRDLTAAASRLRGAARDWVAGVPGSEVSPAVVLITLAAVLLLVVLLVLFVVTRGGGTTAAVIRVASEHGHTVVDRSVAEAVLAGRMRDQPEVLSAQLKSTRVKRAPALKLTVTLRRGASLPLVLQRAAEAVEVWDALAGADLPVIVHLAGRSWRDRWRAATRVR